ncbi:hypothetical protein CYLTODRAFT_336833, partial [Cylindrobasidium torrendii FP15055 ss-10]
CVTGLSVRHVGERFQRSNETVAFYFKAVLNAFSKPFFYSRYVQLPNATDPTPPEIRNNPKLYPFFANALGAVDGTHINAASSAEQRQAARDRK